MTISRNQRLNRPSKLRDASMNGVRVRFLHRNQILPKLGESASRLLASRLEVLEVSLFGSLATDDHAPGSDGDIYILLEEDDRRFIDRIPEFLEYFLGAGASSPSISIHCCGDS